MNGKLGFGQMPAFHDKLTESEVNVILTYIKTWWAPGPARQLGRHLTEVSRGAAATRQGQILRRGSGERHIA